MEGVFSIVERVREKSQIPLVFLTYINPVFFYGYERFCGKCRALGVDGLIIPDLPFEEKEELAETAKSYGVDLISMIAPTSEERILQIASDAEGFLYIVSSMGVTGVRREITTDVRGMVDSVRKVSSVPTAIGFGISTPEQAKEMAKVSDGAIVGSAVVKIIAAYGTEARKPLMDYVRKMKTAVREAAEEDAGEGEKTAAAANP